MPTRISIYNAGNTEGNYYDVDRSFTAICEDLHKAYRCGEFLQLESIEGEFVLIRPGDFPLIEIKEI